MAKLNVAIKKAELNKFYKILILLVKIFIIPVLLLSILCSICFLSTKLSGNVPTFFNTSIITLNEDVDDFKKGEKIGINRVDPSEIKVGEYVAYFEPTEEETKEGSQVLFRKVAEFSVDPETNEQIVAFEGESYYIVKNALIGRLVEKNNFVKNSIIFFSSKYTLVFLDLLPLSLLLLALVLYLLEYNNVEKINKELMASQMERESGKTSVKKEQVVDKKTLQNISEKTMGKADANKTVALPKKPLPSRPVPKTIHNVNAQQKSASYNAPLKNENAVKTEVNPKPSVKTPSKPANKPNATLPMKPEHKRPERPSAPKNLKDEAKTTTVMKPPQKPPVKPKKN